MRKSGFSTQRADGGRRGAEQFRALSVCAEETCEGFGGSFADDAASTAVAPRSSS